MKQYISKDALVAELNRLIAELVEEGEDTMFEQGRISAFEDVKVFINHTLEMKEVDLEKEVEDWVKIGPHTSYPWCTIPDAIRITAEHFYELGLKAQKG